MKSPGLTGRVRGKVYDWRDVEENGIPGVAVTCVDIGRNTSGEGGSLDVS